MLAPVPKQTVQLSCPAVAVQVSLEGSRGTQERPLQAYPDLCFAVDNFDETFRSLVRHCICVHSRLCPSTLRL